MNNLKLPKGWRWVRLEEVCFKPQYGYTVSAVNKPIGPKLLRITDIQEGKVDWNLVPYCKINKSDIEKYRIEKNDIFFARTGATTGKSFLIEEEPPFAIFASYLIRIRLIEKVVHPKFVSLFFQSPYYWKQVIPQGGAQPNMNARKLASLQIPLPPLPKQKRIVAYLDNIQQKAQTLQKLQEETEKEIERLKETILHKAFRGECSINQR